MKPYKIKARIHSLDGKEAEVTVIGETHDNAQTIYIVEYGGVKCTAIFNIFTNCYYADDVYGRIEEE